MSINSVTIAGNLTRDFELRATSSGFPIGTMSIAVNERVKVNDEWTDKPNYFDVVLLGKRAEIIAQYLVKGTKVCVSGKLRWSQWERDGEKRSKVEIIAEDVEFMSRRESAGSANPAQSTMYEEDLPW